jgi:hypothetical protein
LILLELTWRIWWELAAAAIEKAARHALEPLEIARRLIDYGDDHVCKQ